MTRGCDPNIFHLHETLTKDTIYLGDFPLSAVLLHKECDFEWIILVPRIAKAREIYQLPEESQRQLYQESNAICQLMDAHLSPDKINIATIGNLVHQLHFHHVARYQNDALWPKPIWGNTKGAYMAENEALTRSKKWQLWLSECDDFCGFIEE